MPWRVRGYVLTWGQTECATLHEVTAMTRRFLGSGRIGPRTGGIGLCLPTDLSLRRQFREIPGEATISGKKRISR